MCGYDTFWMAEHHFQPEGTELIPNLSKYGISGVIGGGSAEGGAVERHMIGL